MVYRITRERIISSILRWDSNNQQVADRELFHGRVRAGALEICTDEKTGRFVGVHLQADVVPPLDPFPEYTVNLEFDLMASGAITAVSDRLIPFPYPHPDVNGNTPRLYDIEIEGVTYLMGPGIGEEINFTKGPYSIRIGYWGLVVVQYDQTSAPSNPANGVTTTILNVTRFRLCNLEGTVISNYFTNGGAGFDINITGETPPADTTPPTVLSVLPSGINVSLGNAITLNCSETVVAGTGNFYVFDRDAASVLETISVSSAVYSGSQIILTPSVTQTNSTNYSIRWDAGAFKDSANNNVTVNSGDAFSWQTVAASGGGGGSPSNPTVDTVVNTAAALRTLLLSWQSNWAGTVPSGKTANDDRVIGLNANTTGTLDASGLTFPQKVYIRHVGTFSNDYTCSVYHQGQVTMDGSTNVIFYLMDIRSHSTGFGSSGLHNINNTVGCGFVRCVISGWPIPIQPNSIGYNAYAYTPTNTSDALFLHVVYRYFRDGHMKPFGTNHRMRIEGCMGLYSGGDDYTMASNAVMNDCVVESVFLDRHHQKVSGYHNDGWQLNGNTSTGPGAQHNRHIHRYTVAYRGYWQTSATGPLSENGWQAWYMSGASASSVGPFLQEHCLVINGQKRGIDRIPGTGIRTARYCAAIDGDYAPNQTANARFPAIIGQDVAERNFVTATNASYNTQEGTGGIRVNVSATDHSGLLAYMEAVPTEYTDLWDIRPKAGTKYHPAYTPASDRVGPFELWEKLLAADPKVCLSQVGWPVATLFIADFDYNNNFGSTFTGNFDADGNNV